MNKQQDFEVVAIGDTAVDAFIKLKDADLHCDIKKEDCQICFNFRDKVPYESVTVCPATGNASNASTAMARLGLKTALVSVIGDDDNGNACLQKFAEEKIDTRWVKKETGTETNYHFVLWYGDDRTILVKHEKYNYTLPDIGSPNYLYLSSLSENSLDFHNEIIAYLEKRPEIKLVLAPGTFQIKLGQEKLAKLYQQTNIFISNKKEAQKILEIEEDDVLVLLEKISELGPKIVIITDADNGSWALSDGEIWHAPIFPLTGKMLERTGAGDAFAGALIMALSENKNLSEALAYGAVNASAVIMEIGPQKGLLNKDEIESRLKVSGDFRVEKIK
jgi:ribokinase